MNERDSQPNSAMRATVTLSLGDYKVTVDRGRLSGVSKYFSALFSHNFKDSKEKVYNVGFDIDPKTLKTFANWIDDPDNDDDDDVGTIEQPYFVRSSLVSYLSEDFGELLDLLKLSVFYAVDQLANDIIGILASKWLLPENVIGIWKLAEELNLIVLRSLCIATSLDRFEELPEKCLMALTKEQILQLLTLNQRIRPSNDYVRSVAIKWTQRHAETLPVCTNNVNLPTFVQCRIGYKVDSSRNRKAVVYCWDGRKLFELIGLRDWDRDSAKEIVGMQATGRGFSVYVVGGERGFGTGNFNMEIWRYCLISQRWYYQSRLPIARRHMVAAFLHDKLVIVGGVGRLRLKLDSVDILDIRTGQWRKAARVPEEFTEVPPHCVLQGKLFLLKSSVYIYEPKSDCWQTVDLPINSTALKADAFVVYGETLVYTSNSDEEDSAERFDNDDPMKDMSSVPINSDSCQLKFLPMRGINVLFLATESEAWAQKLDYVCLQNEKLNESGMKSINPKLGSFDLINRSILCSDTC